MTYERRAAIDFTSGYQRHIIGLLYDKGGAQEINFWVFVDVFVGELWIGERIAKQHKPLTNCTVRSFKATFIAFVTLGISMNVLIRMLVCTHS